MLGRAVQQLLRSARVQPAGDLDGGEHGFAAGRGLEGVTRRSVQNCTLSQRIPSVGFINVRMKLSVDPSDASQERDVQSDGPEIAAEHCW